MQEQFTAWSVLVDAGLIGALLAVGTLARAVITPLQTLMIPASVIAGILGLDVQDLGAAQTGMSKDAFKAMLLAQNQQPDTLAA